MKRILLICYILVANFFITKAQEAPQTLLGGFDKVKVSGFGGPSIEVGTLDGSAAFSTGGGGAVMFNNFFIGGYGARTVNSNIRRTINGENLRMYFNYGGLWLGYDAQAHRILHFTTGLKFGWGNVSARRNTNLIDQSSDVYRDRVYVVTPEAGVEVNITKFMKIGLTGGYRFTSGASLTEDNGSNINLNSHFMAFHIKFGWFGQRGPIAEIKRKIKDL